MSVVACVEYVDPWAPHTRIRRVWPHDLGLLPGPRCLRPREPQDTAAPAPDRARPRAQHPRAVLRREVRHAQLRCYHGDGARARAVGEAEVRLRPLGRRRAGEHPGRVDDEGDGGLASGHARLGAGAASPDPDECNEREEQEGRTAERAAELCA